MEDYNGDAISDSEWYAAEDSRDDEYEDDKSWQPCENCGLVITSYGYPCSECEDKESS